MHLIRGQASVPVCVPHRPEKTLSVTPFACVRLFAYDAPAPSAEKAAWEPHVKNEVFCEPFVVHRVEAPGSLDLSHPYSFDRIENPVSLDSEDCDDDSETSGEKFASSPRRRLVIKLPVGGPPAKKKRPLPLAETLDAVDSSLVDMDRHVVGEMVQTPRASCKALRVDQESPRSVFATASVVTQAAQPVTDIKRHIITASQPAVLPPTILDSRRSDLDEGADAVLRFPAAVERPLLGDIKHAGPPQPVVGLTDRTIETPRNGDCDRATRPPGYVGAYSKEARKARVALFLRKRARRVWTKKVKYDVRKNFADSRMRVKGRFVKKEDEDLLRDLVSVV